MPAEYVASRDPDAPFIVFGLLRHENKTSVVNYAIKLHSSYDADENPIKSKDQLVFFSGARRFAACPIFSQHTTGNKQKFERFMPPGDCVATVIAPITFPPGPVLVFRETEAGLVLVATGSLLSVNPDRVVIKRIRLAGHPYKLNKRTAVIRYMFFRPEDILWFKPVELITKYGRRGHIKESLGTHGHMKWVLRHAAQ